MQFPLPLQDKVCLVTGASRGIGKAIAAAVAAQGAKVAINYCYAENLARQFSAELQEKGLAAEVFQTDISSGQQVDRMFTKIESLWGPVDLLVNNAGVSYRALITDCSEEDWHKVMEDRKSVV